VSGIPRVATALQSKVYQARVKFTGRLGKCIVTKKVSIRVRVS